MVTESTSEFTATPSVFALLTMISSNTTQDLSKRAAPLSGRLLGNDYNGSDLQRPRGNAATLARRIQLYLSSITLFAHMYVGMAMNIQSSVICNCACMQDMGVDAVLQSSLPVERGGVLTKTKRGQLCYDMSALTRELQSRYAKHPLLLSMVQTSSWIQMPSFQHSAACPSTAHYSSCSFL